MRKLSRQMPSQCRLSFNVSFAGQAEQKCNCSPMLPNVGATRTQCCNLRAMDGLDDKLDVLSTYI